MIVIKFGGTSVGDASNMRQAISIVSAASERNPVVVVSALGGVTNQLVEATQLARTGDCEAALEVTKAIAQRHEDIAFELVGQKSDYLDSFLKQLGHHVAQIDDVLRGISVVGDVSLRSKDKIVAIGEKLSSVLFSYTMRLKTLTGVHIDSGDVIVTDERFGEAMPAMDATRIAAKQVLIPEIEQRRIPVMGGFFGRSPSGATTTLGRGGSDFSAAIVGAALGAEEIQIWTDVDGMMTCDPRLIPNASVIELISYPEAAELAYFGAKVLHPKTISPAVEQNIPIRVLNTSNPESRGTLITREGKAGITGPRAIAVKRGVVVIHLSSGKLPGAHGFLRAVFQIFEELELSVGLITTSEVSLSLTVDEDEKIAELEGRLAAHGQVEVRRDQGVISLIGRDVTQRVELVPEVFRVLASTPMTMVSIGSSRMNFSMVIPETHLEPAVRNLHRALFEQPSWRAA